jgi:uncharacterized membrane protein YedE/YeeE
MHIDWQHFTPWSSLAGGVMLGLAAALFALLNGRILGISGILGGLRLRGHGAGDRAWRVSFLLGLLAAPLLWMAGEGWGLAQPGLLIDAMVIDADWSMLIAAGLLVGLGTRYGAGCTSGHGVCGLSRLSPRSLVATMAFMGAGFATVYVLRHIV